VHPCCRSSKCPRRIDSRRGGHAAPGVEFHGIIAAEVEHARILRGFAGFFAATSTRGDRRVSASASAERSGPDRRVAAREPAMEAILVVRPSSLGDIVHALSIVADIEANRPELAIDWVAESGFVGLLELHPGIRRIVPVAMRQWRHRAFEPATWREVATFKDALQRDEYTAVLDLQEQVKGALIARIARGVRHGPDRASIREPIAALLHDVHHAIDPDQHFIVRCRELAAASLGYRVVGSPRFGLVPPALAAGSVPDRPYVVFFHGTSRADKQWPDAHWRRLVETLAMAGYTAVLPWGSDDERARSELYAAGISGALVPPWRLPLRDLAALSARAELVVGVDTGLVHLAAALGTPTVSLFVATDPKRCGVGLAGPSARDLGGIGIVPTVDEVQHAAGELMRRMPAC
jgi:heptosyltransferase-1